MARYLRNNLEWASVPIRQVYHENMFLHEITVDIFEDGWLCRVFGKYAVTPADIGDDCILI
jgi:hypothetical protein